MTASSSDQTASTLAPKPMSHAMEKSGWRASARAKSRLSRQSGFWAVAFSFLAVSAFSTTPSALYGLYAHRDHLSSLTITIVYAVYAGGIVVTLVLAGHVSDWYGRRAVLLPALGVAVLAAVLFLVWRSPPGLLVARVLTGFRAWHYRGHRHGIHHGLGRRLLGRRDKSGWHRGHGRQRWRPGPQCIDRRPAWPATSRKLSRSHSSCSWPVSWLPSCSSPSRPKATRRWILGQGIARSDSRQPRTDAGGSSATTGRSLPSPSADCSLG